MVMNYTPKPGMAYNDFVRIIMSSWPDATFDESSDGEIIINTNHKIVKDINSDHKMMGERVVRMGYEEVE